MLCELCGGLHQELGQLGRRSWYRCVQCHHEESHLEDSPIVQPEGSWTVPSEDEDRAAQIVRSDLEHVRREL